MTEIVSPLQRVGVVERIFEPRVVAMRPRPRLLTFGVFELDTTTGELRKEGRLIHLRHQPVGVLRMLLEKAGELVTRREITEALWADDIDVDVEQGLNHCMKEIRAALGDRPESPRFIQTLPRR
ncbi:MAG: winged helix-turn-helix domain-containing protein, partial [Vicinamibacteria bacterium]